MPGSDDSPYQPLSTENKETRILQLVAGWPGAPVKCRLRTISLANDPPPVYEALSYTWGRATQGRAINIHDGGGDVHTLPVTDNLFAALVGLRHRFGRSRRLWVHVDAVCINQFDLVGVDSAGSHDPPGCLYTHPSEWRLRAVSRVTRHHLAGEEPELHRGHTASVRSVDQIALWCGDRALWEEPDTVALSSSEGEGTTPDAESLVRSLFEDWDYTVVLRSPRDGRWLSTAHRIFDTAEVFRAFYDYARLRQPQHMLDCFATSNGFLGLAATAVVEGDMIALIKGCKWPVVLRQSGSYWAFKGICLIHGIMEGELLQVWGDVELKEEDFVLC
ncbi:hypothetical protein B0A55_09700 [Friedmanniomyces simplex]|uniref:Heterokaryon incompatibility domain-containing protein n=1 Tax=Friedmanniomyces simplex TaxID=329884 RepID=A0A4U0WWX9_9PEZI|nr:hypothetical protein B0A55_09700 [Friedmanniomyces simplex]